MSFKEEAGKEILLGTGVEGGGASETTAEEAVAAAAVMTFRIS